MATNFGRIVVLIASSTFLCCGQEKDPATQKIEASIREFLALKNANATAKEMMEAVRASLGKTVPDDEFWKEYSSQFNFDEFTEMLVPIYARYFTQEDLDGILVFYKSPPGKKFIEATPKIARDVMPLAMEWSRKMAEKVMNEARREK